MMMMMTQDFAKGFAAEWVKAWNAHDLERVLSHYADTITIESPMAVKLYPQSKGVVSGKSELRNYWRKGLDASPHLHFKLLNVLVGVHSLTLYLFNSQSQMTSAEMMSFDKEQKVVSSVVTFSRSEMGTAH